MHQIINAHPRRLLSRAVLPSGSLASASQRTAFSPVPASKGVTGFVEDMAKRQNKSTEEIERDFFAHVRPSSLLKRFATVEEVAAMVAYVASELSSATNGAALRVDGGVVRSIF